MQKYFPNEMLGKKYGKLIVKSVKKIGTRTFLVCQCDCGNEIIREPYLIATNQVKSCGCLKTELIKKYNSSGKHSRSRLKDGRSLHPLYGTWFQMISRCENPKQNHYDRYGGRGIKVCEEWHDFWNFIKWSDSVGGRPNGYTLDRINNDGNYEPSNCRWADWKTQINNKSSNVIIEYKGESKTVTEWAIELNINSNTLQNRLSQGWSIDRAFTEKTNRNSHYSRNKKLIQSKISGEVLFVYESLSDLPKDINKKGVVNAIYKNRPYRGYVWKYEDE